MSQEEIKILTLDDIDRIEKHLNKIAMISSNGLKSMQENIDLDKLDRMTTAGYHLQNEIKGEIRHIRDILAEFAQGQIEPYRHQDMETAVHIREMRDNVKVVDSI